MISIMAVLTMFAPLCSSAPSLDHGEPPEPSDYESGVPVITYHQITSTPSKYGATPYKLRTDLQRLYDAGFFLILPEDIESGLFRVPFERRPVMITFDDGWEDNFRYIQGPDGEQRLDPDCAVAIVNGFLEENPDFGPGVVFFISWDKVPFGRDTRDKLNLLLDMGHAIGNHTARHTSFTAIPPSMYSTQVLPALDSFHDRLGLRTACVNTLAYPGGKLPAGVGAENIISEMAYEGRPAVVQGYLVDGSVENFSRLYDESATGRFRISRIDMALYSVPQLLGWRNLVQLEGERTSLHDDLSWRP